MGPHAGADAVAGGTKRDVSILVYGGTVLDADFADRTSRQFPTFAFNSSKKFSAYPRHPRRLKGVGRVAPCTPTPNQWAVYARLVAMRSLSRWRPFAIPPIPLRICLSVYPFIRRPKRLSV